MSDSRETAPAGAINGYGDVRLTTATGHGIDIASQRADDLDMKALDFLEVLVRERGGVVHALDAGCGHGGQAVRMAKVGANVTGLDIEDYREQIAFSMRQSKVESELIFHQASVTAEPLIGRFDVIVSQRMIHYLPHDQARRALEWFFRIGEEESRLYLSASGLSSELGDGYGGKNRPLAERFVPLSTAMAAKHAIYPPVCLYAQDELSAVVAAAGWRVLEAFLSPFGNVKIVAAKG